MKVIVNGVSKTLYYTDINGTDCTVDILGSADIHEGDNLAEKDYYWWKRYLAQREEDLEKLEILKGKYDIYSCDGKREAKFNRMVDEAFVGVNDLDDEHNAFLGLFEAIETTVAA